MDVKEAVKLAKKYVEEVFSDDNPFNIGLEEVERDDSRDGWSITIGFSRPWNRTDTWSTRLAMLPEGLPSPKRSYKVVKIENGQVKSVTKHRIEN